MAEFGGGIDELENDSLPSTGAALANKALSEGDDSLLRSHDATLQHQEIVVDLSVVGEATHGGDVLGGQIVLRRGVTLGLDEGSKLFVLLLGGFDLSGLDLVLDTLRQIIKRQFDHTESDTVDLLVQFSTVEVTLLTSTSNGTTNTGRMPSTDTSNLAETLVSLAGQLLGVPTGGDTLEALTLCDTNAVNHLILSEDIGNGDLFLKVLLGPVNFLGNGSTIDLDLHDVGLLLTVLHETHLREG